MFELVAILVVAFGALLLLNVPIGVAIALASFLAVYAAGGDPQYVMAMKRANGVDSFALLAIPFFVLSGLLMGEGGMAKRLINFASALMGRFPGGLAYVNTLTCMLFGSISGSAAAAISSIGGSMIPEMTDRDYDREFSVAVTTTAATTGLLIPPSNIMIVYAVSAGSVSIAALFLAGVLPGILTGLAIMVVAAIFSLRHNYGSGERSDLRTILIAGKDAFLSLLLVVIVIGGILYGIFTATEAAAIAVAYSFLLAVVIYREVGLGDLPRLLYKAGITTAVVMILIAACSALSYVLAKENIPQTISQALLALSENKIVILMIINLVLLIVGTFMDMTPAVLIFTPIFLPVAQALGMHPVHFGIVMIANLCIGLCTPPVGTCLFVGCGVGKTTITKVTRPMLPFFAAMFIALLAITYTPALSLWLPRVAGLIE